MESLLVFLIVGAAVVWALRRLRRTLSSKPEAPCGCGCSGCDGSPGQDNGEASASCQLQPFPNPDASPKPGKRMTPPPSG